MLYRFFLTKVTVSMIKFKVWWKLKKKFVFHKDFLESWDTNFHIQISILKHFQYTIHNEIRNDWNKILFYNIHLQYICNIILTKLQWYLNK